MSGRWVLVGGLAYVAAYAGVTGLLPPPASASERVVLAGVLLLLPVALALGLTLRAARQSLGAERAFWGLLAAAALFQALNTSIFVANKAWFGDTHGLQVAAHVAYYTYFILVFVALLARPERPLGPGGVPAAALEWTMALVAGYFVVFYFIFIPAHDRGYPWFLVYTIQETAPGVLALVLALRVRDEPYRDVYRLLAAGFLGAALLGIAPNLAYAQGVRHFYSPLDVGWMLPFLFMAAAACVRRGAVWVRPSQSLAWDRRRARLAALAVAAPPLVDGALRVLGVQPELSEVRSNAALGAAAVLSILVAARIQRTARRDLGRVVPPVQTADASEFLQLASGAAHELNNPLMAVAGWAELGLRRGVRSETLQQLLDAVKQAADAVARLQKLARSGRDGEDAR